MFDFLKNFGSGGAGNESSQSVESASEKEKKRKTPKPGTLKPVSAPVINPETEKEKNLKSSIAGLNLGKDPRLAALAALTKPGEQYKLKSILEKMAENQKAIDGFAAGGELQHFYKLFTTMYPEYFDFLMNNISPDALKKIYEFTKPEYIDGLKNSSLYKKNKAVQVNLQTIKDKAPIDWGVVRELGAGDVLILTPEQMEDKKKELITKLKEKYYFEATPLLLGNTEHIVVDLEKLKAIIESELSDEGIEGERNKELKKDKRYKEPNEISFEHPHDNGVFRLVFKGTGPVKGEAWVQNIWKSRFTNVITKFDEHIQKKYPKSFKIEEEKITTPDEEDNSGAFLQEVIEEEPDPSMYMEEVPYNPEEEQMLVELIKVIEKLDYSIIPPILGAEKKVISSKEIQKIISDLETLEKYIIETQKDLAAASTIPGGMRTEYPVLNYGKYKIKPKTPINDLPKAVNLNIKAYEAERVFEKERKYLEDPNRFDKTKTD